MCHQAPNWVTLRQFDTTLWWPSASGASQELCFRLQTCFFCKVEELLSLASVVASVNDSDICMLLCMSGPHQTKPTKIQKDPKYIQNILWDYGTTRFGWHLWIWNVHPGSVARRLLFGHYRFGVKDSAITEEWLWLDAPRSCESMGAMFFHYESLWLIQCNYSFDIHFGKRWLKFDVFFDSKMASKKDIRGPFMSFPQLAFLGSLRITSWSPGNGRTSSVGNLGPRNGFETRRGSGPKAPRFL